MTTGLVSIGIDLGTTNCVVAVCDGEGRPYIIKDEDESRTPSYVRYSEGGQCEVGQLAYKERYTDPLNTVHSIKQIIGRNFYDSTVQEVLHRRSWAFHVAPGPSDECRIQVPAALSSAGGGLGLLPEDISAAVLRHLVANAVRSLRAVDAAVITVPATFGIKQRRATEAAAHQAGIQNVKLMNEPSAAAFTYAQSVLQPMAHDRHVLVFDLGGGTLDVAVLYVPSESPVRDMEADGDSGDHMCIKAVAADLTLGGNLFTQRLTNHCLTRLQALDVDISRFESQPELGTKLWDQCEEVKMTLSKRTRTDLNLSSVLPERIPNVQITRDTFEAVCANDFARIKRPLDEVLAKVDGGLRPEQIDMVLLVGRATRMPRLQSLLTTYLNCDPCKLSHEVDEAEAVAKGAAIRASRCFAADPPNRPSTGSDPATVSNMPTGALGFDVLGKSLSIVCRDGRCYTMLKAGTRYPVQKVHYFEKQRKSQDVISISVVEGESPRMEEDTPMVGQFMVSGLRLLPQGVNVTLAINDSGILEVEARAVNDPSRAGKITVVRVEEDGPGGYANPRTRREAEVLVALEERKRKCLDILKDRPRGDIEYDMFTKVLAIIEDYIAGGGGGPCTDETMRSIDEYITGKRVVVGYSEPGPMNIKRMFC